jgi:hypothetical protein
MSRRVAAVLLALLVVLGGGALYYYQRGASHRPADLATIGQPLFRDLEAAKVAAIAIRDPKGALTLELKGGRWGLAERGEFPADFAKVKAFALKAIELKIGQVDPIGAKDRARLKLLPPGEGAGSGTLVELRAADGKPLASMIVGEKYFKQTPDDPATASADGRFVMLPAHPNTIYVISDPLAQATSTSSAWIDRTGFAVDKVSSLAYRPAEGESWKIERPTEKGEWKLEGAKAGEKLEFTKANAAAYALGSVPLDDVASPDASPAVTGLATPATIVATTFDGLAYTIRLGKLSGTDYYARLDIEGTPPASREPEKGESAADKARRDKEFEAHLKALQARLPRERALAKYVLLLPKASFDDLLKTRAELLQKSSPEKSSKKR